MSLKFLYKGTRVVAHLCVAALAAPLLWGSPSNRGMTRDFVRWWSRRMCALLGMRILLRGGGLLKPALVCANHISWVDIIVLNAISPARFVAKSEVAGWPVIGALAARAGTVFLRRGSRRDAGRVARLAAMLLGRGESVVVFPEGTSTIGRDVLDFRAALFEASVLSGVPVQPVRFEYPAAGGPNERVAFVDEDEFVPHLLRLLREESLLARVTVLPPIEAGRDRRELARAARDRIRGIADVVHGRPDMAPAVDDRVTS